MPLNPGCPLSRWRQYFLDLGNGYVKPRAAGAYVEKTLAIVKSRGLLVPRIDQNSCGEAGLKRAMHGIEQQALVKAFAPMLKIDNEAANEHRGHFGIARGLD